MGERRGWGRHSTTGHTCSPHPELSPWRFWLGHFSAGALWDAEQHQRSLTLDVRNTSFPSLDSHMHLQIPMGVQGGQTYLHLLLRGCCPASVKHGQSDIAEDVGS